jgi:hypothetical protein
MFKKIFTIILPHSLPFGRFKQTNRDELNEIHQHLITAYDANLLEKKTYTVNKNYGSNIRWSNNLSARWLI